MQGQRRRRLCAIAAIAVIAAIAEIAAVASIALGAPSRQLSSSSLTITIAPLRSLSQHQMQGEDSSLFTIDYATSPPSPSSPSDHSRDSSRRTLSRHQAHAAPARLAQR